VRIEDIRASLLTRVEKVGQTPLLAADIPVVRVRGKDDLSIVAALDNVLRLSRNEVAEKACHDELDSRAQDGLRIPVVMVFDPI